MVWCCGEVVALSPEESAYGFKNDIAAYPGARRPPPPHQQQNSAERATLAPGHEGEDLVSGTAVMSFCCCRIDALQLNSFSHLFLVFVSAVKFVFRRELRRAKCWSYWHRMAVAKSEPLCHPV